MDIFEKLFQKISQSEIFKKEPNPGLLHLRDISKYLDLFVNAFGQNDIQFQCVASRNFVGLFETQIFLPEKIDYFNDIKLNRNLYQNLVLQIIGAHHLNLVGASEFDTSIVQRLKFLRYSGEVNSFLDSLLPGYRSFQTDLIRCVELATYRQRRNQKEIFSFWLDNILTRVPAKSFPEAHFRVSRSLRHTPDFLFLTVPSLEPIKSNGKNLEHQKANPRQQNSRFKTEIEKTYSGLNQEIDLKGEKENPIRHSFEKIETADEYLGGRTMDCGQDELSDHLAALDELNLTKVTRGGNAPKSVFNIDTVTGFDCMSSSSKKDGFNGYTYPEWNFKKNSYMENYCHLVQNPLEIAIGNEQFRENLLEKYRFQVKQWQNRIQTLFSEPLWQKKVQDGDEIDIDEIIRDFGLIKSQQSVLARWYARRKKQLNDVEIIILFDQSQSSDSWVNNRRVLDISLEAVGTAGLLFDKIFKAVTVAGIWSATRHNCSFQIYKKSHEPWSTFYKMKESIQARGYTRLGPAIRHASYLLRNSMHKKKLILLLTDGKPTDLDGYEGKMGISDVAQACREAEASGILHYALVLDYKQRSHFSKMFNYYTLLHDPKSLSEELFKVLFRLAKKI